MHKFYTYLLLFLLLMIPSITFATQVRIPDSYFFTSSGGPFVVYDNLTGEFIGGGMDYYEGYELTSEFFGYMSSEYKIVEMSSQNVCQNSFLNYADCIASPYFIQVVDTINLYLPLSDGGGGGGGGDPILDEELTPSVGSTVTSYTPEVTIYSVFKGLFFSDKLEVDYKATDQNDNGNEKGTKGLGVNPVSIYLSDKITNWYDNFFGSDNKTLVVKDQPKEGVYKMSVKDLVPGVLYKVIVEVVDLAGLWGQGISDYFSVDFTAPVFTIKVNPIAVRNGEVTITIDSSEDLLKIPEVKIVQNGGEEKSVTIKGEKTHYEGKYNVISGFDGTATVLVSGIDIAGNIGDLVIGGGTFNVGVNPPVKPIINKYQEKIVTIEESIDISGTTREDTEVVLKINGVEISKIKPDSKGSFTFTKIPLDKKKNKGINYIEIYAIDPLGSHSDGVPLEVKYNIAPTIKIVKPLVKDLLSNISPINVEAVDENTDTLFYTYQVLPQADYNNKVWNWTILREDDPSSTFYWNTTEVEDGNYIIQVIANDGIIKTTSNTVQVSIKNVLPYFRFENGKSTITSKINTFIKGKALTSVNISPRPSIVSVAYSMDGGSTWIPVKITDDGGSYQKKFSVEFSNLKEGSYPILWRTKDSRGFIGRLVHPLVIDKTPPKEPIVTNFKQIKEIIITDSNDENLNKSGIQISIKGKSEALNTLNLIYNGKILTTKSLPTGAFNFTEVTFEKTGRYEFKIWATDQALNKSLPATFSIIYNNLPAVTFLNPKPFRGLPGKANISWNIKDIDGDVLSNVTLSYRNKNTDTLFKNLVTNGSSIGNYDWDTSNLVESNNYELKISVDDSYSSASQVITFSIDRTQPSLTSFIFDKNQTNKDTKEKSFVCIGSMTDNLSGLEFIEYKIEDDSGKVTPWYKGLIVEGFLKNKANFSIKHPISVLDGSYKISARAVDASGNVSETISLSLSVDKNAPRIGGFFVKKSGVDISPDEEGRLLIYKNSMFLFNISLEEDTENAVLKIGKQTFVLKKDIKSQLWFSEISLNGESTERILIDAEDNVGNKIENKDIGTVTPINRGSISITREDKTIELIAGAVVRVLKLNKDTGQYSDYTNSTMEHGSVVSNQNGGYDLILPQGEYKFVITGPNIRTLKYKYNISRPSIVNLDFEVSPPSVFTKWINNFIEIFK